MNIVISEYVEDLFKNAPTTRDILDIKEELAYNLNEKFEELVRGGISKENAFQKVTEGVGNIQELIMEAQKPKSRMFTGRKLSELEKTYSGFDPEIRKSFFGLVCSSIWLFAVIGYVFLLFPGRALFGGSVYTCGWLIFLVAAAVQSLFMAATNLPALRDLNARIPCAESESENILLRKTKKKLIKKMTGHASTILWMVTIIIYILFSFATGFWAFSWLIFIAAAVLQNFLVFSINIYLSKLR